jgi:ribonucleotide reductase beta subunit family protein with ferritin-like domain
MILSFFAASDTIVNINLGERFIKEVQIREAIIAYNYQMHIENIHCVSEDTVILTDEGYFEIGKLENKQVNVWNGNEFTNTTIKFTGNSELYKITLDNGMELKCTSEHKWFIRSGNQLHPESCKKKIIFTKDLKIDDVIWKYKVPTINILNTDIFLNPYIHGFFCGDGSYVNDYPIIYLYDKKKLLIDHFGIDKDKIQEDDKRLRFYITNKINKNKFVVPINYDLNTKLKWLEGLCDSDGTVKKWNTYSSIQISNTNYEFLKNVQLMLTTISILSVIRLNHEEELRMMPDGKGEEKEYLCKSCYVLYLSPLVVTNLINLGFQPKRLIIKSDNNLIDAIPKERLIRINKIEKLEGIHKTLCFTEEKEHAGIFNGILTGQSETYSLQIDNIIRNPEEKHIALNAIENYPCIKKKADWAFKWIESRDSFAQRLIAFAIVEGVFFSGAFCSIFWLKKRNLMPGLCDSNELIARDEGMHASFACLLYTMIVNKLDEKVVHQMFEEAYEIEKEFICESLPCSMLGMNNILMTQYIKFVSDRLLQQLNYNKLWNEENPFDFMESISMEGKTNFFESRPTQYQKASVLNTGRDNSFTITNDF